MQKFRKGSYSVIRFSQRSFRAAWPHLFQSYEARVRNGVPSSMTEQWATKNIEGSFLSKFLSNLWLFCRLIKEGLTYHRKQPRVTFFFFSFSAGFYDFTHLYVLKFDPLIEFHSTHIIWTVSYVCAPLLSQRRFIVNMQCQKINESSSRKQLQTRLYEKVVCFHTGWLSACP